MKAVEQHSLQKSLPKQSSEKRIITAEESSQSLQIQISEEHFPAQLVERYERPSQLVGRQIQPQYRSKPLLDPFLNVTAETQLNKVERFSTSLLDINRTTDLLPQDEVRFELPAWNDTEYTPRLTITEQLSQQAERLREMGKPNLAGIFEKQAAKLEKAKKIGKSAIEELTGISLEAKSLHPTHGINKQTFWRFPSFPLQSENETPHTDWVLLSGCNTDLGTVSQSNGSQKHSVSTVMFPQSGGINLQVKTESTHPLMPFQIDKSTTSVHSPVGPVSIPTNIVDACAKDLALSKVQSKIKRGGGHEF